MTLPRPKYFTGKKALLWFAGFFLVVFAVNGIMIYIALGSWGGLETDDAYRKGLNYNDEIAAAAAQKQSGWTIALHRAPAHLRGDRIALRVEWPAHDLPPVTVTAHIGRAVTDAHDQDILLSPRGGYIYTAPVTLPAAGQWNITFLVARPDGFTYRLKEKILLAPESAER